MGDLAAQQQAAPGSKLAASTTDGPIAPTSPFEAIRGYAADETDEGGLSDDSEQAMGQQVSLQRLLVNVHDESSTILQQTCIFCRGVCRWQEGSRDVLAIMKAWSVM